jgi:hypothetical protein
MDIIKAIETAYKTIMGPEKWDSLTDQEKHDAVMIITRDALRRLEA